MNKWIMSTPKTEERPPAPTILFGVPEGRGQSPGGQSPAVLAQMRKLSSPQEGPALTGVSHGVDSRSPRARIPSTIPGRAVGGGGRGGAGAAASCPGASGRAEREGRHTPSPAAATPGLRRRAGGPARAWLQRVWAASPRRPVGPPDGPAARPAVPAGNAARAAWNAAGGAAGAGPGLVTPLDGAGPLRNRPGSRLSFSIRLCLCRLGVLGPVTALSVPVSHR